jgi:hypothetical protein
VNDARRVEKNALEGGAVQTNRRSADLSSQSGDVHTTERLPVRKERPGALDD